METGCVAAVGEVDLRQLDLAAAFPEHLAHCFDNL